MKYPLSYISNNSLFLICMSYKNYPIIVAKYITKLLSTSQLSEQDSYCFGM